MSDHKQAVGSCTEISERSGWTTFHIDAGTKYPLKLATKKTEVVEAARAVGSALTTWTYTEKESETVNEHTGKPYVNRYLEAVSAALPDTQPSTGSSTPQDAPRTGLVGADKDRAITRMACLKAAAETLTRAGVDNPDADAALEVMKIAQRYEQWVMRDIEPTPFQ